MASSPPSPSSPPCGICQATELKKLCPRCLSHEYCTPFQIHSISVLSESYALSQEINDLINPIPLQSQNHTQSANPQREDEETLNQKPSLSTLKESIPNKNVYILSQKKAHLVREEKKQAAIRQNLQSTNSLISTTREKIKQLKSLIAKQELKIKTNYDQLLASENSQTQGLKHAISINTESKIPAAETNLGTNSRKLCNDLSLVFDIKRRRPATIHTNKGGSSYSFIKIETYIQFIKVPNYLRLGDYNYFLINAATDRIAYFCQYLAYYLRTQLPYPILLPQPGAPYVRIGIGANGMLGKQKSTSGRHHSSKSQNDRDLAQTFTSSTAYNSTDWTHTKSQYSSVGQLEEADKNHNSIFMQKLELKGQFVKMIEADEIREFEGYSMGLAMLILDLAYIATLLGITIDENMTAQPSPDKTKGRNRDQRTKKDKGDGIISVNNNIKETNNLPSVDKTTPSLINHHRAGSNASVTTIESTKRSSSRRSNSRNSVTTIQVPPTSNTHTRSASPASISSLSKKDQYPATNSSNSSLRHEFSTAGNDEDSCAIDDRPPSRKSTSSTLSNLNQDCTENIIRRKSANNGESLVITANKGGINELGRTLRSHSFKNEHPGPASKSQQESKNGTNNRETNSTTNRRNKDKSSAVLNERLNDGETLRDYKEVMRKNWIRIKSPHEVVLNYSTEDRKAIKLLRVDKLLVAINKMLVKREKKKGEERASEVQPVLQNEQQDGHEGSNSHGIQQNYPVQARKANSGGIWGIGGALWKFSASVSSSASNGYDSNASPNQIQPKSSGALLDNESKHSLDSLQTRNMSSSSSLSLPLGNKAYTSNENYEWPSVITVRDWIVTGNLENFGEGGTSSTEWNLIEADEFE